jgi:hypothetical protein
VFAEGFARELARLGYKPNAAADQLRLMAHLSRWMNAGHIEPASLTPQVTGAFLAARRAEGYVLWLSPEGAGAAARPKFPPRSGSGGSQHACELVKRARRQAIT